VRLDPWPVWKNQRRLVAIGGVALALTTGLVWLTTRGQDQTASTINEQEQILLQPAAGPEPPPVAADETLAEGAPDQPMPGDEAAPPEITEGEAVSSPDPVTPDADAVPLPGLPSPDVASKQPGDGQPPESEAAGPSAFRDCEECPEMVVLPAGRFTMGAPSTDPDAEPQEKPQREVAIDKDFALGRYEVTEKQWQTCVEDGVCRADPQVSATDFPDYPKTRVNWRDAQAFVRWLNQKTEQKYRLPTEKEWEYAARAGTDTRYPWGHEIGQNNANCRDCGAAMGGQRTALVGSFAPNAFGLFDMAGNVWEWTTACGKSASKTCTQRIVRGGSWGNSASAVRVSQRLSVGTNIREDIVGFRVARDMP
jgi:formylglycine-generating enzyme required for sulfatase activity